MSAKLKKLLKSKKKNIIKKKKLIKKKTLEKPKQKVLRKKKIVQKQKIVKPAIAEELVGVVTHYFPHVKAGVVKIKKGSIATGDSLHIKGHTTDLVQKVASLQIDNQPIDSASKGKEIGVLVKSRVRHNDKVYKIK